MQRIVAVLLVLWGVGWVASQIPAAPEVQQPRTVAWRRTCDGWERAEQLFGDLSRPQPVLHPAVAGLVLLLFALAALSGLAPDEHRSPGSDPSQMK
jgi:hypothetical protein